MSHAGYAITKLRHMQFRKSETINEISHEFERGDNVMIGRLNLICFSFNCLHKWNTMQGTSEMSACMKMISLFECKHQSTFMSSKNHSGFPSILTV